MAEYIDLNSGSQIFNKISVDINGIDAKIPSNASSSNKMVTASDIATKADLVDGKVPSSQLPSYVDDVLEYSSISEFPATGESGKIYVDTTTNKTYRWGGSDYVEISESLALGETSSTAYAGNKGKANADAISDIQDLIPSGASTSNKLATASDIPTVPTALSQLSDDSTHRLVTDTEKSTWSGKQDALTFDNAPTANSNNPVKSGGIKTAIDNSFSASESEIKSTVGWVGKNKAKSYKVETFTEQYYRALNIDVVLEPSTSYKLVFDTDNSGNQYFVNDIFNGVDVIIADGTKKVITVTTKSTLDTSQYNLNNGGWYILKNYTAQSSAPSFTNVMVMDASISDPTYEPYHASVEEEINQVYADNGVLGAKNPMPFPYYSGMSKTENGVTFTVNSDGSITINTVSGGATGLAEFVLFRTDKVHHSLTGKRVRMSGCPSGGSESSYYLNGYRMATIDGSGGTVVDTGNGIEFDFLNNGSGTLGSVSIYVKSGTDLSTPITFKPMLRLATDTDSTYAPYAMTNRELTQDRYYRAGETIYLNNKIAQGFITSGSSELQISIDMDKPFEKNLSASTFSIASFTVRGINGYIVPLNSAFTNYKISSVFCAANSNALRVTIKKSDDTAFADTTNNTPVMVTFEYGCSVTLA